MEIFITVETLHLMHVIALGVLCTWVVLLFVLLTDGSEDTDSNDRLVAVGEQLLLVSVYFFVVYDIRDKYDVIYSQDSSIVLFHLVLG